MATVITDAWRNVQMGETVGSFSVVDFDTNTIEANLVDDTDLSAPAGPIAAGTFDSRLDVEQGTEVATGVALVSKTVGSTGLGTGIFDAGDMTGANNFPTVTGDNADYLCVMVGGGTAANDVLIIAYDSTTVGLILTPNGGDVDVTWNAGGILTI